MWLLGVCSGASLTVWILHLLRVAQYPALYIFLPSGEHCKNWISSASSGIWRGASLCQTMFHCIGQMGDGYVPLGTQGYKMLCVSFAEKDIGNAGNGGSFPDNDPPALDVRNVYVPMFGRWSFFAARYSTICKPPVFLVIAVLWHHSTRKK